MNLTPKLLFEENVLLAPLTTMYVGGPARYFLKSNSIEAVNQALEFAQAKNLELLFLGGGSNILVNDTGFSGMVIKPANSEFEKINESVDVVWYKVGAEVWWDTVVEHAIAAGLWGIENLTHIPGTMGGLVIQNAGAYGQEASDVVAEVEVLDTATGTLKTITHAECGFGYRKSIFNSEATKGKFLVWSVTLKLQKQGEPQLNYGDLTEYFKNNQQDNNQPTLPEIRSALIAIRGKKFPYPVSPQTGSCGSFLRGPILNEEKFEIMRDHIGHEYSELAVLRLKDMVSKLKVKQGYKTPTAFLLELCNLKGYSVGGACINQMQPTVIGNFTGTATAKDVMNVFRYARRTVYQILGAELHAEPELIGFSPIERAHYFNVQ